MREEDSRTALLLGEDGVSRLAGARVAVFGVGGVGGYAVEALARAGIGALDLVDGDAVSLSNINRQIFALHTTVGLPKVDVARARVADIRPQTSVRTYPFYFDEQTAGTFDFSVYDFVLDCVDDVRAKVLLAERALSAGVPFLAAMGAGNKFDPTAFRVAKIEKTSVCPLARVMRREYKARGLHGVRVVYSEESPAPIPQTDGKRAPGSLSFVPSAMGLIMAGEVVRAIAGTRNNETNNASREKG